MSGDAHHITAPPEDGEGARLAMVERAARCAAQRRATSHYLNAHATSTPLGDRAETIAIKRAFGDHAYKLPVSSTKSMTGHLLGAAGVVEAIFSILAIRDQRRAADDQPRQPGSGLRSRLRAEHGAASMPIDVALSNSFGFGGTNGSLIFRRSG